MRRQIQAVLALVVGPVLLLGCGEDAANEDADESACPEGFELCGLSCIDLGSNNLHCGACDAQCAPGSSCVVGQCACQTGLTLCNGASVNVLVEGANCGDCVGCGGGYGGIYCFALSP